LDGGKGISNEIVGKRLKGQNKKREGWSWGIGRYQWR
jgi:hypothetical protein